MSVEYNFEFATNANYPRIEKALVALCDQIEETLKDMNEYFFKLLEKEYEYLTSEEQVAESIIANEMTFTEDGQPF